MTQNRKPNSDGPASSRETIPLTEATTGASRETILPTSSEESRSAQRETIPPGQADSVAEVSSKTGSGIPQEFGRYRLEECLGQGAMGAVYKAHDTQLDRLVALKVPKFDVADSALLERFYREARSAATLSHPNICPVHDVGEIGGIHYISMGYLEGKPLSAYVRPDKPLTEKQAVMIIRKLVIALNEAHRQGIIHRDLKPDNVMIDRKSNPVIMDFGLARRSAGADDIRVTQGGQMLGTPAYMSPEQAEGDVDRMGPRCDVYSLGVILYELLTGRLPFEGSIASVLAQIMKGEPKPPAHFRSNLNPELQSICLKMMAANQDERYETMADVARDLAAFITGKPTSVRNSPTPTANEAPCAAAIPPAGFSTDDAGLSQLVAADDVPVSARTSRKSRLKKPATAAAPPSKNSPPPWAIWSGAAAGTLAILLAGYVLFVRVGEQTVRIEIDDPKAQVFVDGDEVQIKNLGATIELTPGKHGVQIRRGDIVVKADSFTVLDGDNPVLQLDVLKKAPNENGRPLEVSPDQPSNPVAAISKPTNSPPSVKPERPAITETPPEFAQSSDPEKRALGFLLSRGVLVQLVYEEDGKFLKSKMVQKFEDVEDGQFKIVRVSVNEKNRIEGDDWSFVKSLPDVGTAHFFPCPGLNDAALAHLAGHPSIGLLQIDVGNLTDAGLAVLQTLPKLNTLHLSRDSNNATARRLTDAALEHLVRIPRLRILDVVDSDVSDAGLARLSAAPPPELRSLNLAGSKVTDQGSVHLRKLTQLTDLTLNNTQVGDGLAVALGDLAGLTNLNLSGTKAGDSVLQAIAGHQKLSHLQLSGTRISDAGIAHLQKLPALEQLTLNGTQVTDDCLILLGQIKSLEKVLLYECSVTSQAVQQLLKTRPTVKIDGTFRSASTTNPTVGTLTLSDKMPEAYRNSTDAKVRLLGWMIERGMQAQLRLKESGQKNSQVFRSVPPAESFEITTVFKTSPPSLKRDDWDFLSSLPDLDSLVIRDEPEFDDAAMARLADNSKLGGLSLHGTSITDAGLRHLVNLKELRSIQLNNGTDESKLALSEASMEILARLPSLWQLHLENCSVTDANLKKLANSKSIKILTLAGADISAAGIRHLQRIPELHRLDLRDSVVTEETIVAIGQLRTLSSLGLGGTPVGSFSLRALSRLPGLATLDLQGTTLTDTGLKELSRFPGITKLFVNSTSITDSGIKELVGMKGLTDLGVAHTKVSNESINIIAGMKKLKLVHLGQTQVTLGAAQKLQDDRPDLQVLYTGVKKKN